MDNYQRKWREANREKSRTYCRKWWGKNKDTINEKKNMKKAQMTEMEKEEFRARYRELNKIRGQSDKRKLQYRSAYIKRKYGISLDQYEEMLKNQNGVCAICKEPETFIHPKKNDVYRLAIDHNHDTGEIRELLCRRCNTMLGECKENQFLLLALIEYLKKHTKVQGVTA